MPPHATLRHVHLFFASSLGARKSERVRGTRIYFLFKIEAPILSDFVAFKLAFMV
jgi:hypothetical protein